MNKHDFYKELMSRYTFDEEKIRRNAKRASSPSFLASSSKWLPLTTAAAVFLAVFGGYTLFFKPDYQITTQETNGARASIEERVKDINSFEQMLTIAPTEGNIYISFSKPLTYKEFESVLNIVESDTGDIEIISLWNGEFVTAETAYESDAFYSGAKVFASVDNSLYTALSERPEFSAVEREGAVSESNFEPLITERPDAVAVATTPPETTAAATTAPDVIALINDGDIETTDTTDVETPIVIADGDKPDDVIEEIETIEISAENVKTAEFINENFILMLTDEQIQIYGIEKLKWEIHQDVEPGYEGLLQEEGYEYEYNLIQSVDATSPKIVFTDPETGTLLITAADSFGRQTELFMVNPEVSDELITQLVTSAITESLPGIEINYAFYNNGEIILKAQNPDMQVIYTADETDGYIFKKYAESPYKLVILSQTANEFIYAEKLEDGEFILNIVYRDGTAEQFDMELSPETKFERSPNAKNFAVITEDGAYIYNAELTSFTAPIETAQIKFSRYSGNVLNDGAGKNFLLYGTEVVSITETEADALSDAEKPTFTTSYRVLEITPDTVSIEIF